MFRLAHAWGWLALGVFLVVVLGLLQQREVHRVEAINELFALSLPAQVEFDGKIVSVRDSGSSLLIELDNLGKISCYWRNPPELHFFFSGERVHVSGKLEQTSKGKLCVVSGLVPLVGR